MDALDYALTIGGIFVLIFTIVMDILLVRELMQKRRKKENHPGSSEGQPPSHGTL